MRHFFASVEEAEGLQAEQLPTPCRAGHFEICRTLQGTRRNAWQRRRHHK